MRFAEGLKEETREKLNRFHDQERGVRRQDHYVWS